MAKVSSIVFAPRFIDVIQVQGAENRLNSDAGVLLFREENGRSRWPASVAHFQGKGGFVNRNYSASWN